jgi:uncharacterized protein YoxC
VTMSSEDRILLEDMNHKFTAILEGIAALAGVPAMLIEINERLTRLEDSAKTMRAAITDQSKQLNNHETRITKLEQSPT